MTNSLKFILSIQLKHSGINKTISGFTLIELLVGMIMAILVITPLMAFMINILDTDRKEQAKVTSEQEIQAALDYIARDLQQAVYIYDDHGVSREADTTIDNSGIKNQIPPLESAPNCSDENICKPVLVFWKRELIPNSIGITASSQTSDVETDDGFAYSLVAYYLITNTNNDNTTWSKQARIGRFQLKGPVNAAFANTTGSVTDTGFNPPPLDKSGATLKNKMNQWQTGLSGGDTYGQRVETLIDYIKIDEPDNNALPSSAPCSSLNLVGSYKSGFFACVDANEVLAQVYIRGNALARVENNNLAYSDNKKTYFPSASIRVQGRGFLFTK
ncbi:MAG: hormogonium polysaccharide secretion pseudopilin HpsC [Nostoc sp. CreGUA01]|nr:hormogonium polysaccharide secretion pseudopilin HpsC [Nostoc sp. CreGUA01]